MPAAVRIDDLGEVAVARATGARRLRTGLMLAEGPTWEPTSRVLSWVDMHKRVLHRAEVGGEDFRLLDDVVFGGDRPLAAAIPLVDGYGPYLIFVGREVRICTPGIDPPSDPVMARLPLEAAHINDARLGPDGRIWCSAASEDRTSVAGLWSVGQDWSPRRERPNLVHGNGIDWSPDSDQVWVVDSAVRSIYRYGFELGAGAASVIGALELVVSISQDIGVPDGLAVDCNGEPWVALWGAGCVLHLSRDGVPLEIVGVPENNATSCTFVGDSGVLAVTTAADAAADQAGSVYLLSLAAQAASGAGSRDAGSTDQR